MKVLIDSPYFILSFDENELKFDLMEANKMANSELGIFDSLTMRLALR